jgi:molybdopterin molybdotransferase
MACPPHPQVTARLDRKLSSEPGVRTFARVEVRGEDEGESGEDGEGNRGGGERERVAVPTRTSGSGILSSVALADGWVVVPESREGIPAGETVTIERWEWSA